MKMKFGQQLALVAALLFASMLVYEAPFEASATNPSSSQVVYAPITEPPMIGNEKGKLDLPLLLLELGLVALVGGAIVFASGQYRRDRD